jgi:hypothetical protein
MRVDLVNWIQLVGKDIARMKYDGVLFQVVKNAKEEAKRAHEIEKWGRKLFITWATGRDAEGEIVPTYTVLWGRFPKVGT